MFQFRVICNQSHTSHLNLQQLMKTLGSKYSASELFVDSCVVHAPGSPIELCNSCADAMYEFTYCSVLTVLPCWSSNEEIHYTSQHLSLTAYMCTEVHSHSTVHWTDRFYCLIPAVCSLHHRCRSLQSCRLYWRDCVDHLWEYQDHHSR